MDYTTSVYGNTTCSSDPGSLASCTHPVHTHPQKWEVVVHLCIVSNCKTEQCEWYTYAFPSQHICQTLQCQIHC